MVAGSGVLVAAIGVTRLVLGFQWPTDVLAGWALGATVALAVTIAATLLIRAMPPASSSPDGRLRRVAFRVGHVVTAGRPPGHRRGPIRAA